jgi:polyhydroxybutyrate depolymerase
LQLAHYFPAGLGEQERRPLLVYLHGLGGSGRDTFYHSQLAEFGRTKRVFVVAPDGARDSVGRRFWNAHPACCDFDHSGRDDVARLDQLIGQLLAREPIDPQRVFVIGFSNGGFMAHRLACRSGHRLAGIVSIAGAGPPESEQCRSEGSLRVLEIHGDADQVVHYQGGTLFGRPGPGHGSAPQTLARWGKLLDCSGRPAAGPALDLDRDLPGAETTTQVLKRCRRGATALWTVRGGGHGVVGLPGLLERAWEYLQAPASR